MDLAFAISGTGSKKDKTFQLMKDTIGRIVDQYGTSRIRYSIIVYDNVPTTKLLFGDLVPSRQTLDRIIDSLPQVGFDQNG
mgnify:CR=1 FL=1